MNVQAGHLHQRPRRRVLTRHPLRIDERHRPRHRRENDVRMEHAPPGIAAIDEERGLRYGREGTYREQGEQREERQTFHVRPC